MQDRNTVLLIVIVFGVSIVALIVVLVVTWQIIGGTVTQIVEDIARYIHLQNLDYNFPVE